MTPAAGLVLALGWIDAEAAFSIWADDPHVAWLDSQGPADDRGRYSTIAIEPFSVITGGQESLDRLAGLLDGFKTDAPLPFAGGAVGFLGYELGAEREGVTRSGAAGCPACPACLFGLYDVVLAFDRRDRNAWLLSSGWPERNPARRAARARLRADHVLARLHRGAPSPPRPPALAWRAETSRAMHESRVARVIGLIAQGELCQANITARFIAERPPGLSAAGLHLALRAQNPAPFGAYLGCGPGLAVASVSPERFLSLSAAGAIEARPIKGTRPRSADAALDAALAAALRGSAKDRAENLMIVDLLRHDIGRVAEIGSVHVPALAELESFAHVHHLVSVVRGRLRRGLSGIDLLRAAIPGGSVTGAPKVKAMQVINALEPAPRGPYCGAVVWLGWDGAMDSSIAIRTLAITPDQVIAQAGGGIVADSDPAEEYEEMMVKIRPLLRALGPWPE